MTEEEARQLRKENTELKEEASQKDRRIEDLEGRLMSALLRLEELERRLAKEGHNSSKPPSSDGFKRRGKKHPTSNKTKGGQAGHTDISLMRNVRRNQCDSTRQSRNQKSHSKATSCLGMNNLSL
jgi:transposase